jgi:ssDNA-binding Zn-finger/Zn-ribbon topoisomerase 1
LRRRDFTTEETDEVCSEGHPMVIRLGRNGRFLACSLYPEHKETRPLPGEETPGLEGEGETCPQCGQGTLATKRGRFGAFLGCSRYPECDYIRREGPPPPSQLPFEVVCPKNGDGHLVARRARRTGNVFWGCSAYPKCDFTTNWEPTGAVHETDEGPVARKAQGEGICLKCGAAVPIPEGDELVGRRLAGGPPDPAALQRPVRAGRAGGRGRAGARVGAGAGSRPGSARTRPGTSAPRGSRRRSG